MPRGPRCHHQGSIHVDRRAVEKLLLLPCPDIQPRFIDGIHQAADVRLVEAAAGVACRGGIGNPLGAQGVEEHLRRRWGNVEIVHL